MKISLKHSKPQRILFRADANQTIGFGHLIRSLALADMLHTHFETIFVTRFLTPFLKTEIELVADQLIKLDETEQHIDKLIELIQPSDIVVLDNYFFDIHDQKAIKANGAKLVCIDDLADKLFVADLIINHTINFPIQRYQLSAHTDLAIGLKYALLRKAFLKPPTHKSTDLLEAFICYGGADNGKAEATARELSKNRQIYHIHLVTTHDLLNPETLRIKQLTHYQNIDASHIRHVMDQCQIGFSPASTLSLECISSGMLLFLEDPIDNQMVNYKNLIEANLAYPFEQSSLSKLDFDSDWITTTIKQQQIAYDAKQSIRFIELFQKIAN